MSETIAILTNQDNVPSYPELQPIPVFRPKIATQGGTVCINNGSIINRKIGATLNIVIA